MTSIALTGVAPAMLQTWLGQAQQALADLNSGNNVTTVSYAQGEGNRTVTYTKINAAALRSWISELQQALGVCGARRSPIRPRF